MTRRLRHVLAVLTIVLGACAASAVAVEPTRESLLEAWEAGQRADQQTRLFERVEPGRYRFATERFPFDGVVRVLNVVIDDRHVELANGFTMGMVEVKLEEVGDDFLRDHGYSVGLWQSGNTFYFDSDAGTWLDSSEWQRRMMDRLPLGGPWSWLSANLFWILFLPLLAILLWLVSRKANRQMKNALAAQDRAFAEQARAIDMSQQMLDLARDSNHVLREILTVLRAGEERLKGAGEAGEGQGGVAPQ